MKNTEDERANGSHAVQVWRKSRVGRNTGNRAGLIKHIEDCCGGKFRHKKTGEETQHWNKDKISKTHVVHIL